MRMTMCGLLMMSLAIAPAFGLEQVAPAEGAFMPPVAPIPPAEPVPAQGADVQQALEAMGLGPQEAMLLQLLNQPGLDPMMLMLIMGMMDGGNIDDDLMGMMLFSKILGQGAQAGPPQPIAMVAANALIIVDDGTVYKINLDGLTLEAKVAYRPKAEQANPLAALLPLIAPLRGDAVVPEPDGPRPEPPAPKALGTSVELPPPTE